MAGVTGTQLTVATIEHGLGEAPARWCQTP